MANEINYLECFLAVAESLSFSAAAKHLRISQPCVSRQVRLLEELLDTQLLVRDKHHVSLTRDGEILLGRVAPLFREIAQSFQDLRTKAARMEGTIAFGCLPEIGVHVFSRYLMPFQRDYPGLTILMRYLPESDILGRVKEGRLDFGVVPQKVVAESIRCYKFLNEEIILVTRAANSRSLGREANVEFIAYSDHDVLLQRYLKLQEKNWQKKQTTVRLAVNSHRSIVDALLTRDAWAVLPKFSVEKELASGSLKIVASDLFASPLFLVCRENHLRERRNEVLLKFLQRETMEHRKSNEPFERD